MEALPLSETGDPFVDRICWRLPGCPLTVIFMAPLIMVGVVLKAGAKHPAMIALAFFGTFAGRHGPAGPQPL